MSRELDHTGRPVANRCCTGGLHDADYREAQVALDGLAAISITDRFG